MPNQTDYLEINKESWNKRTNVHLGSEFYDMPAFMAGKSSLKEIELEILGDISGKEVLHLQCHFGQDTLSLARMGAKCTGVDLSNRAIEEASKLNDTLGLDSEFICCDVYSLPVHLDKQYDIVFTTYGTIGWLPDMDKWAQIVFRYLKPGGRLVFADFHPVVWMFDDHFSTIQYRYFQDVPIVEEVKGSYTDGGKDVEIKDISWNHSMSEVVNALLASGLEIRQLNEYDFSPWNCFAESEKVGEDRFRIAHLHNKIPMVYAIEATKK